MIAAAHKINTATKIVFGIVAILLCIAIYADLAATFWGDQDWELLVASMMLHGKKLYVDHVPVTGPLLFYLYALPAFISQHLSFVEDYQALVLCTLLLTAIVIILCFRIIKEHAGFQDTSQKLQWIMLLCLLLIIRIFPNYFGDREHLFIILTLPYLLRFMPGLNNATFKLNLRFLIGIFAAVGFCIKPHCLLLFAGIQIVYILFNRTLRILYSPENITIYLLGLLYGLIIWCFTPEYFSIVLPFAFYTYSAIKSPSNTVLNIELSVALTFAMLRPKGYSTYRKDIYYLSALLPFLWLYVHFNNGWPYTYLPFMSVLLLINGFVLWEFLSQKPNLTLSSWRPLIGIALCLINFSIEALYQCGFAEDVLTHPCHGDAKCPGSYKVLLDEIGTSHAHSFGVIGTDFTTWARVAKLSNADWNTRFPQLWMLPKLIIADDGFYERHKGILFYAADALADDLNNNKPDIVFAERFEVIYTMRFEQPIDWVEMLNTATSFKEAWKHYKFVHTINNCASFAPSTEAVYASPTPPKYNCRFDVFQRIK